MDFTTPSGRNPIDRLKIVGRPVARIDGPLKVTGTAPYAYERHDVIPNQAYGYVVGATVANSAPYNGYYAVDGYRRCGWERQYDRYGFYIGTVKVCRVY